MATAGLDTVVFGQRLRHLRRARGLTLDALGQKVGKPAAYLSMVENGHREARLSLIEQLAGALDVSAGDLLAAEPPSRRARLEIALLRAQDDPLYRALRLPWLKPSARVPDDVLEHIVALFEALKQRHRVEAATPEAARRANASLRAEMRARNNYFPDIEQAAASALAAAGYEGTGAVAERVLTDVVAHFGFTLHRVKDLPASTEAVADLRHRRIYIHQRNSLPTRAARSVVLQTLGHFALGHADPADFGEFLRQRVEANYFAGAVLAPERPAVELIGKARREGDIAAEDLKQVFYISYEMAAHRLTNLATHHFEIPVHFLRADEDGVIWKAYENDGIPFPCDEAGVIEGERVCRQWGARQAFRSHDRFADHAQYTTTPGGTFWCTTQVEIDRVAGAEAVTIGTRHNFARYFRGHDTALRARSRCPDFECCVHPPAVSVARWQGKAWPSVRVQSYVLAALPAGTFPGADLSEVYDFLDAHAPEAGPLPPPASPGQAGRERTVATFDL
ncbi:MAG TPA: helix-turn-helix domain-containing protein [Acidimicrobiales bacterium]|jgi:XRE family transcriptional regulator, fatty acid utilization regulator|nr:helix-turn-helix domain-containing protein [Acidimicrobiales bacterium]